MPKKIDFQILHYTIHDGSEDWDSLGLVKAACGLCHPVVDPKRRKRSWEWRNRFSEGATTRKGIRLNRDGDGPSGRQWQRKRPWRCR